MRRHLLPLVEGRLVVHDRVSLNHSATRDVSRHAEQRIFVAPSAILDGLPLVLQVDVTVVAAVRGRTVHEAVVLDLQLCIGVAAACGHGLRLVG